MSSVTLGALRQIIDEARVDAGCGLTDLTALSPQNDPYRLDTPANHIVGRWFAEQMERLEPAAQKAAPSRHPLRAARLHRHADRRALHQHR